MDPRLDQLIRKEFGLGAPEASGQIAHATDSRLPQFEFEWHPKSQKVYRMDNPGGWERGSWKPAHTGSTRRGFCISEHCLTHGQFLGFVQTFCRAYLLACKHQQEGILNHLAPDHLIKGADPCPTK